MTSQGISAILKLPIAKIYKYTAYVRCLTILEQESHDVAGKPRDAAVNSDRYQQPVRQKQSK